MTPWVSSACPAAPVLPEEGFMSQGTTQRAEQVKGAVAEQSGEVAGTAKEQVQQVASEAAGQARDLAAEARDQVRQQTDTQRERLAGTLHQLGDELRSMAEQSSGSGVATEVARQAADRVHGLGSYVERNQPGDLLGDIRAFARRRPGTFLLGAAAAGVLAGRLTRGAKAAASGGSTSGTPTGTPAAQGWSTDAGYPATSRPPGNYAATPPPVTPPVVTEGVTDPGTGPVYETEVVTVVEPERRTGPTGNLP
jgi:uncharacterized protein YjbJ (UPF0337 family)